MQNLPRRLSRCALNDEPFEQGAEYLSILDEDGCRKDYCLGCWEKISKPVQGHYWRGKIPVKKAKLVPPDEQALLLFRQVLDPKERYILAIYLQRKHQLVQRTATLYELPETGEIFDIERVFVTKEEGGLLVQELLAKVHGITE